MVLAGIAAARLGLRYGRDIRWLGWRPKAGAGRVLIWAGRHSLILYLLHQPVLLGMLYGVAVVVGPSPAAVEAGFMQSCERTCAAAGAQAARRSEEHTSELQSIMRSS